MQAGLIDSYNIGLGACDLRLALHLLLGFRASPFHVLSSHQGTHSLCCSSPSLLCGHYKITSSCLSQEAWISVSAHRRLGCCINTHKPLPHSDPQISHLHQEEAEWMVRKNPLLKKITAHPKVLYHWAMTRDSSSPGEGTAQSGTGVNGSKSHESELTQFSPMGFTKAAHYHHRW